MEPWAVEYRLLNASPEYVFDWLEKNTVDYHRVQLEESLLARNDNLINLGLALYASSPSVGYALFKSDDLTIKRASLCGMSVVRELFGESWVINDDVLPFLLEEEKLKKHSVVYENNKTLLHELFNNKFLPVQILEAVYEKTGVFSDIDDDLWVRLVAMTAKNERLSTAYDSDWMDGWDEYTYNRVFHAAWQLFMDFPVNTDAAGVLSYMSRNLVPETYNINALDVIERWRSDDAEIDEKYSHVRTGLVSIIGWHSDEFKTLKNHEDLALRKGYYANLRWVKPEDVVSGFEKDGTDFLDSALFFNESFFREQATRDALKQACWNAPDKNSSLDYPNYFNATVKRISAKHPDWFKDEISGEPLFEEIVDTTDRLEKRLEYLTEQVAEINKALIVADDVQDGQAGSALSNLRIELQDLKQAGADILHNSQFIFLMSLVILGIVVWKLLL